VLLVLAPLVEQPLQVAQGGGDGVRGEPLLEGLLDAFDLAAGVS